MQRANLNLFFFSLLVFILINYPLNFIKKNTNIEIKDELIELEKETNIFYLKSNQSSAYLLQAQSIKSQMTSISGSNLNLNQEIYSENDLNSLKMIKNTKFIFITAMRPQLIKDSSSVIEYIKLNYKNVLCSPRLSRNLYSFLNMVTQFKQTYQLSSFLNFKIIDDRSLMLLHSHFEKHLDNECKISNNQDEEMEDINLQLNSYYSYLSYLYPKSKFIYIYEGFEHLDNKNNNNFCNDYNKCIIINSILNYSNKEIDELLK
jgi:hypothetical protein